MNFGKNVRYLRKRAGISQDDLADRLGYKSPTTIQKWEVDGNMPPIGIVQKVADFFHVGITELLNDDIDLGEKEKHSLTVDEERVLSLYRSLPDDAKKFAIDSLSLQLQMASQAGYVGSIPITRSTSEMAETKAFAMVSAIFIFNF